MTHYKMLDRVPSVLITSNRNELKIYQKNVVYLNNGDNFELRFFNPLQEKIGVEIIFNGIKKSNGYLVLKPGEDLILDRFLDEQKKMIFETYQVDSKNKDVLDAITKNGEIVFNFYKEKIEDSLTITYGTSNIIYNYTTNPYVYTTNTNVNDNLYSNNVQYINNNTLSCTKSCTNSKINKYETGGVETGRVETGNSSKQKLNKVNIDFEFFPFNTITYKLMPHSTKNKSISDVRLYCTYCGYRIRNSKWKFCPRCGEKN